MAGDFLLEGPGTPELESLLNRLMQGTGVEDDRPINEVLDLDPEEEATEIEEDVEYEDDRVRTDVEAPPKAPTTINLFQHPEAHPIALDMALLRKYGPEWMQWEPETLEMRILSDFRTRSLSDLNMDKLQALITLHARDEFWRNWEVFLPCSMALNGIPPDFDVMQAMNVPQAMISVDIANRIRRDVQWSLEIKTFLSVVHLHDGMFCPIPPLNFVEVDAEEYPVECEEVRSRWDQVRSSRTSPEVETPEDEQLRRMLEAWTILEESRAQLRAQLPLLYNE